MCSSTASARCDRKRTSEIERVRPARQRTLISNEPAASGVRAERSATRRSQMTIAEQVRGLAEGHAAALPAEVKSAFAREQAELAALEPVEVIAVGERLPDSDLLDAHGHATTLQTALDGRPAVLVFYRGAWCPYCNIALNAYQAELLGELDRRGVTLVALSPQTPDG